MAVGTFLDTFVTGLNEGGAGRLRADLEGSVREALVTIVAG
jgi:hypothetical protein